MKPIRLTTHLIFSALIALFSLSALAQYQWIDANGRKVYSDQPPPASVPNKKILQQPGKATPSAPVATSDDPTAGTAGPAATATPAAAESAAPAKKEATSKDKELEAKKKQADDAEAAKKKAEQEANAKAKADNCVRAKSAKASLDSGVRIATTNAKGERSIMDEASRIVESKRIEGIMAADCK